MATAHDTPDWNGARPGVCRQHPTATSSALSRTRKSLRVLSHSWKGHTWSWHHLAPCPANVSSLGLRGPDALHRPEIRRGPEPPDRYEGNGNLHEVCQGPRPVPVRCRRCEIVGGPSPDFQRTPFAARRCPGSGSTRPRSKWYAPVPETCLFAAGRVCTATCNRLRPAGCTARAVAVTWRVVAGS